MAAPLASTDPQHPFSADRPIQTRSEDRLGRLGFAEALAASISSWRGRDSIAIGVYGPWGSGKTSIKNLTIEKLNTTADRPEILEFNPWQYRDFEALRRAFFDDLGKVVRRKDSATAQTLARQLKSYSEVLSVGEAMTGGLPKTVPIVLGALGLVGLGSSGIAATLALPWVATGSTALLALAGGISMSRKFSDWLADWLIKRSANRERSAPELKKEISNRLAERTQPVLVVMDDVDRLRAEEIRHLLQLVKVNADFPNVSYLLLFQRDIVERALGEGEAQPGRLFLEKIVQVPFDIPAPRPEDLHSILYAGLDRLLESHPTGRHFDSTRWANVFSPGLRHCFGSLRDVNRLLSTLEFQFGLLSATGTLEVDPIDLIAMETLRVFEPEVFHGLRGAKELVTSVGGTLGRINEATQKSGITAIVDLAEPSHRPWVTEIVRRLFPTIEWVFGGSRYGDGFVEQWQRDLRVCTPDFFDRYFRFGLAVGDLSHADLQPLLSGTASREQLRDHLVALHRRGLLPLLFERLEAHKQERDRANAAAFVTAVFDVGDLLPKRTGGFATIEPVMHAGRVVLWFLRAERDLSRRLEYLEAAIEQTTGLILPVQHVAFERPSDQVQRGPDELTIQAEALPRLEQRCAVKIEAAGKSGQLLSNPHLLELLFRWKDWAGEAEVRKWVESTIQSDVNLVLLLKRFVQVSHSYGIGDYAGRSRSYANLRALEEVADLNVLEARAAELDLSQTSPDGVEAVALFTRALRRRRSGKPDEPHIGPIDELD